MNLNRIDKDARIYMRMFNINDIDSLVSLTGKLFNDNIAAYTRNFRNYQFHDADYEKELKRAEYIFNEGKCNDNYIKDIISKFYNNGWIWKIWEDLKREIKEEFRNGDQYYKIIKYKEKKVSVTKIYMELNICKSNYYYKLDNIYLILTCLLLKHLYDDVFEIRDKASA